MKSSNRKNMKNTHHKTASKAPVDLKSVRKKKKAEEIPNQPNTGMLKRREFFMLLVFTLSLFFMLYRVGFIQFVKGENIRRRLIIPRPRRGRSIQSAVPSMTAKRKGLAISLWWIPCRSIPMP